MFKLPKKTVAIVVAGLAVVAGTGAAYAYWTTTGSGSGSVSAAASTVPVTVVQTSTIANLAPGVAAQSLAGKFTNTNTGPVYVTQVVASIGTVTKDAGAPSGTCDATDFTLATPTMTVGAEVPVGTSQGAWTGATIAFNDKPATNQNACKLATVQITYVSS